MPVRVQGRLPGQTEASSRFCTTVSHPTCGSLCECWVQIRALPPERRRDTAWVHVAPGPFPWLPLLRKEAEAIEDTRLVFSSEKVVYDKRAAAWKPESRHWQRHLFVAARQVLATHRRAIVIASTEAAATVLRPLGQQIAAPPPAVFDAFMSDRTGKQGTARWLQRHGMGAFAIREFNVTRLLRDPQRVAYPLVIKPTTGIGGHGITIVRQPAELTEAVKRIREHSASLGAVLAQEAVEGTSEWGIYFAAFAGRLVASVCKEFVFASGLFVRDGVVGPGLKTAGAQPCGRSPFNETHLRELVGRTRYHGFGCLGIKARGPGQPPALIEMNTRVGYSMMFMRPQLLDMVRRFADAVEDGRPEVETPRLAEGPTPSLPSPPALPLRCAGWDVLYPSSSSPSNNSACLCCVGPSGRTGALADGNGSVLVAWAKALYRWLVGAPETQPGLGR